MPERRPRTFRNINHTGQEGQILENDRAGVTGAWVVRTMDRKFPDGIDTKGAEQLRQRYRTLTSEFGELIPQQKIIRATDKTHYVVAQERLTFAEPADVFVHNPSQVTATVRSEIQQLVEKLKIGYTDYLEQRSPYDEPRFPALDLGPGNLLVTADEHVRFVDTGLLATSYADYFLNGALLHEVEARLATLEVLSGRPPLELVWDPFYRYLMRSLEERNQANWEQCSADPVVLKSALDKFFLDSPLRGYLQTPTP